MIQEEKGVNAYGKLDFLPGGKTAGDIIKENDPFAIEISD